MQEEPTCIMSDNQWCIALIKNLMRHSHTKHIDVQHHFIRETLENEEIQLNYYPLEDMIMDILTKPLENNRYQTLIRALDLEAFTICKVRV